MRGQIAHHSQLQRHHLSPIGIALMTIAGQESQVMLVTVNVTMTA